MTIVAAHKKARKTLLEEKKPYISKCHGGAIPTAAGQGCSALDAAALIPTRAEDFPAVSSGGWNTPEQ